MKCAWCDEPFARGETHVRLPYAREPGFLRFHDDCRFRQFIGSLAHLRHECSCFVKGSTCTDPPEMTLREAASAAVAEWRRQHGL